MEFSLQFLHPQLLLIRWFSSPPPGSRVYQRYLQRLQDSLENADRPLYLLSDLRFGCVVDDDVLQAMTTLCKHHNVAGSTAFSLNPTAHIYVRRFARKSRNGNHNAPPATPIWDTAEEALRYLYQLNPDVMQGVRLDDIQAVAVV